MQLDYPQVAAPDPGPTGGPMALWALLAIVGVVLGSAAFIAALAGSGVEHAGAHLAALRKVCVL